MISRRWLFHDSITKISKRLDQRKESQKAACGVADQTIICPESLDKGELQVAGKERDSQLSNQFKDIATIVMQTTINAETRCAYTVSMIEHLMHEVHFAVDPNSTSKKRAQDVILEFQKHYPIKMSPMRLKLTLPVQDFSSLERKLIKWESIIFSRIECGGHRSIVYEIDPELFHDCDAFVSSLQEGLKSCQTLCMVKEILMQIIMMYHQANPRRYNCLSFSEECIVVV